MTLSVLCLTTLIEKLVLASWESTSTQIIMTLHDVQTFADSWTSWPEINTGRNTFLEVFYALIIMRLKCVLHFKQASQHHRSFEFQTILVRNSYRHMH